MITRTCTEKLCLPNGRFIKRKKLDGYLYQISKPLVCNNYRNKQKELILLLLSLKDLDKYKNFLDLPTLKNDI